MEEEKTEICQNNGNNVVDVPSISNPEGIQVLPCNPVELSAISAPPAAQPENILPRIVSPNGKIFNFNENISKYFLLRELVVAREDWQLRNWENLTMFNYIMLAHLCNTILDPIRDQFGPVQVRSGFRYPEYNKSVGGVWDSQHCFGQAADIVIKGVREWDVVRWVANSTLKFGQVISEPGWTHVSLGEIFTGRTSNLEILEYDGKQYFRLNKNMERV